MGFERLIKSVEAHSLCWKSTEESAVDRVTAIGFAAGGNETGEAMLRVNALDANALHKVIHLVARRLNHKLGINRIYAKKIVIAALHEYMRPLCHHCGGKGHHYQKATVVRACSYCDGSGLHRYSNRDRIMLIGGNQREYSEHIFEEALNQLRDSIRIIVINADRRLND